MPGKQMAIDADMSAGLIDEEKWRAGGLDLEEESGFYGGMDGAAKFVRGDAIAGLIITVINSRGGLAIGMVRTPHGARTILRCMTATFTTTDRGRSGLDLRKSRAAGLHRGRHRRDQGRDRRTPPTRRWCASLAATRSRWRWPPVRPRYWRCCRDCGVAVPGVGRVGRWRRMAALQASTAGARFLRRSDGGRGADGGRRRRLGAHGR